MLTFPINITILPDPKNRWSKHDFFALLNVPVGVHERVENLLTRIGIHDLSFCDRFLLILELSGLLHF